MSAIFPHAAPPRGTAFRAALLLAAAGTVLIGCGGATEPVSSHGTSAAAAGTPTGLAGLPVNTAPVPPEVSPAPAATPASGAGPSPRAASAAGAPPVAPIELTPEELAGFDPLLEGIDLLLAGVDTELTDAAHDAATPEGDLG